MGLYSADVSAAFDRVHSGILIMKLHNAGVHPDVVEVVRDWLSGRSGKVIVGGASSDTIEMLNMVFQGTTWGPPLWNLHFSDSSAPIFRCGFSEIKFADDLNAFRSFSNSVSNDTVFWHLYRCQSEVHSSGRANAISFDDAKEKFRVLSHVHPHGASFKSLGITLDCKLSMIEAIAECAVEAHWRLTAILRARRFF